MSLKTKADFSRLLGTSRPGAATTALDTAGPARHHTVTDVQDAITAQVGQLDLGWWENRKAVKHRQQAQAGMQRQLTTAQVGQATELLLQKIDGEVKLLCMEFSKDFSDRIAALAENASASQMLVLRKLRQVEAQARNFLFHDLKAELDDLAQMLADGVIDEDDLKAEADIRIHAYSDLKATFAGLMQGYQGVVQNAYQGGTR